MFKVLHLVSGSISGGAARGSYWLHRGLRELGVDSFLLANSSAIQSGDDLVNLSETTTQKIKFSLVQRLGSLPKYFYPNRKPWIFNTGFEGIDFTKHPIYKEADIIHLHGVEIGEEQNRFLNQKALNVSQLDTEIHKYKKLL